MDEFPTIPKLTAFDSVTFEGKIHGGLIVHPDNQHLVYAIGNALIIEEIGKDNKKGQKYFLHGHEDSVTCIAISNSGQYIASGQRTYMGFKADVIIWDYASRSIYCRLSLHKVKIEGLAFSPNDKYLASLGGQDDGSVIIWDIASTQAICGAPAQRESAGTTYCIKFLPNNKNTEDIELDTQFVTGGDNTLRVWKLDVGNRKIHGAEVNMGQLKRIVKCVQVAEDGSFFYCGTTTGDILAINCKTKLFQFLGPEKNKFSLGVSSISLLKTGILIAGAGDGTVEQVKLDRKKKKVPTATLR